jgi:hypothetical protein
MGNIYAKLTLKNAIDAYLADEGKISEDAVHQVTVDAFVDSGCEQFIVTEAVQRSLGLEARSLRKVEVAGGAKVICRVIGPVLVQWEDRDTTTDAWVLPGEADVLFGNILMEALDVMVYPHERRVAGAHGSERVHKAK